MGEGPSQDLSDRKRNLVDVPRQINIALRDAAGVMRGQDNVHPIVDIAPFRVVVGLFGEERYLGHEGEGLAEVFEFVAFADGVAPGEPLPAV